jgi:fimbrial chaperone protein
MKWTAPAIVLLLCAPAGAADLLVNPLRIELSAQYLAAPINLKNDSDKQKILQIQTVAWLLKDGNPIETPTSELLVSPLTVNIAPGAAQTVHAVLKRPPDATRELAYRIYLREYVPQPQSGFSGVRIATRTGLPVFVQSQSGTATPKLAWSLSRSGDNTLKLMLRNDGDAHVQVISLALSLPRSDKPLAVETHSTFVLARQAQDWQFGINPAELLAGGPLHLSARTDSGNVELEISVDKPPAAPPR